MATLDEAMHIAFPEFNAYDTRLAICCIVDAVYIIFLRNAMKAKKKYAPIMLYAEYILVSCFLIVSAMILCSAVQGRTFTFGINVYEIKENLFLSLVSSSLTSNLIKLSALFVYFHKRRHMFVN